METERLKTLITRMMSLVNMAPDYVDILTSNVGYYEMAFTTIARDAANNYEMFEQLGDVTVNKAIKWYFFRRFPQINCPAGVKTLSRLLANYSSRDSLGKIALEYGFWPHIRMSEKERSDSERQVFDKDNVKMKLLEDTFEAFAGVTEYLLDAYVTIGTGYSVLYSMIESIFDRMQVSLIYEDLFDAKTRLKELFDKEAKSLGQYRFVEEGKTFGNNPVGIRIELFRQGGGGRIETLARLDPSQTAGLPTKAEREKAVSEVALVELERRGIFRKRESATICP